MIIIDKGDVFCGIVAVVLATVFVNGMLRLMRKRIQKVDHDMPQEKIDCKTAIFERRVSRTGAVSNDFRIASASPDTTMEEYFDYFMSGLDWPKLDDIKCDTTSSNTWYLKLYVGGTVAWIWGSMEDRKGAGDSKIKQLNALFKRYKSGDITPNDVSVETIVARARGGSKVNHLYKYGYRWEHM